MTIVVEIGSDGIRAYLRDYVLIFKKEDEQAHCGGVAWVFWNLLAFYPSSDTSLPTRTYILILFKEFLLQMD